MLWKAPRASAGGHGERTGGSGFRCALASSASRTGNCFTGHRDLRRPYSSYGDLFNMFSFVFVLGGVCIYIYLNIDIYIYIYICIITWKYHGDNDNGIYIYNPTISGTNLW